MIFCDRYTCQWDSQYQPWIQELRPSVKKPSVCLSVQSAQIWPCLLVFEGCTVTINSPETRSNVAFNKEVISSALISVFIANRRQRNSLWPLGHRAPASVWYSRQMLPRLNIRGRPVHLSASSTDDENRSSLYQVIQGQPSHRGGSRSSSTARQTGFTNQIV